MHYISSASIRPGRPINPILRAAWTGLFFLAVTCLLSIWSLAQADDGQAEPLILGPVNLEKNSAGRSVISVAIGIETLGGQFTELIAKSSVVPVKVRQVFSTAADQQDAVKIHLLAGNSPRADGNISLGQLEAGGFQLGPRGFPRIEVTIEADKSGRVSVSAKDLNISRYVVMKKSEAGGQRYLAPTLTCFQVDSKCIVIGPIELTPGRTVDESYTKSALAIQLAEDEIFILLESEARLPIKWRRSFAPALENQKAVSLKLYEIDRNTPSKMISHGEIIAESFSADRQGQADLEFVFEIDSGGTVGLQGTDRRTGQPLGLTQKVGD